jgi:hypothetical protein
MYRPFRCVLHFKMELSNILVLSFCTDFLSTCACVNLFCFFFVANVYIPLMLFLVLLNREPPLKLLKNFISELCFFLSFFCVKI